MNNIDWSEVDEEIKPLVRALREDGFVTVASCQGGNGHTKNLPWVSIQPNTFEYFRVHETTLEDLEDTLVDWLIDRGFVGFETHIVKSYQASKHQWKPTENACVQIKFWSRKSLSVFEEDSSDE